MEGRPRARRSLCVRVRAVSPPRPWGVRGVSPEARPPPRGDGSARSGGRWRARHVGGGGARDGAKNHFKKGNSGKTTTKPARGQAAAGAARRVPRLLDGEKEKSNGESLWELRITTKGAILTQRWSLAGAQGQQQAEVCRGYFNFQGQSYFKSSSS